jgi:hypothetical protein
MTLLARLRRWFRGPETGDGFGQSHAQDLIYIARARRCRRQAVAWRAPTDEEAARWAAHPVVGRFGDGTVGVATVDGRNWVVRENDWWGWPDPDRYPFFVLDGDAVWAATDFNDWPRAWTPKPDGRTGRLPAP